MSYTAPQYVDTKEQAVLALASVIADEDKTALGNGSVNKALDVLADVLAQQDVQVPQTNAGAILALAQYAQGGGGGAQTTDVWLWNDTEDAELAEIIPASVKYVSGVDNGEPVFSEISFEHVTDTINGTTVHGIRMSNVPAGAVFDVINSFSWTEADVMLSSFSFVYATGPDYTSPQFMPEMGSVGACCLMPISGLFVSVMYVLSKNV